MNISYSKIKSFFTAIGFASSFGIDNSSTSEKSATAVRKSSFMFFSFTLVLIVLVSHQLFAQCTTSTILGTGAKTWVAPAGTTSVIVEAWGGGGGGGNGTASKGGGGGGGGAYASSTLVVIPGVTYNMVIGAGGAATVAGGASSFGATLVVAAGGGGGSTSTSGSTPGGQGAGGTTAASTGTTEYAGGTGGGSCDNDGGGGGGSAGSTGAGGNGGNGCSGDAGAAGAAGSGGGGPGGLGSDDSPDVPAKCGKFPGGGGGGAEDESGEIGAIGAHGQVKLTYTSTACPGGVTIVYSGATLINMTSAGTKTICSGANTSFALTGSSGTSFTWIAGANANVTGESTTTQTSNTINNTLTNTTSAVQTVSYTVTPVAGCNQAGVAQVVNITVNPLPTMTSANAATICSGGAVSISLTSTTGGTFSWIAANNANTTGESTTSQPTSTINNTIVNGSASNQTVVYTVTPVNSCGTGTSQTVNVLVKVPITLSSSLTPSAVCSGSAFTYTPTSTSSSPTYAWSRAVVAGISNGASSGTGNVNETLINTTSAAINVTYVYVTTSGSCIGPNQNVVVSVKPPPTLSSATTASTCSGTTFAYTPTSSTPSSSFAWSRATVANITQAGTSGTSGVSETLTNTSGVAVNVTYTYTITASSCSYVQNVVVGVNGSTKLSSTLAPTAICSATAFTYTATSNTAGATFAWSRAAVAGISQALSSGTTNTVSETLTNTTPSAINVTYVFVTTANGCSNTENVVVSVKPKPVLNSTLTGSLCSGGTYGYTATSATAGPPSFSWTRAGVAGINAAAAGSGTGDISEVLTITSGTSSLTATYSYTTTLNGCSGTPQNLVVTVNPIPVLNSTLNPTSICSGTTFTYTATSATSGATFAWTRAAVTGITEAATSGTAGVSEELNNTTTAAINVIYRYTTTAGGCSNTPENVTVSVKPLPILNSTLAPAAICSGATFTYNATSATADATFSWSRATVVGITEAGNSNTTNPVSQVLTNTISPAANVNVTYTYTTSAHGCIGASQNVVVSVRPLPQGTFVGNTICNAGADIAELTFSSTAGTGPFTLAYDDPTPTPRWKFTAASNTPFAANPNQSVAGTYVYRLDSITDANGCIRASGITTPSATVTVTSGTITANPATPASDTKCAGTTVTFNVVATGVTSYTWQVNTTGANGGTYDVNGTWTTIDGTETGPTYNGYTSATLVATNATTSHDGYRFRSYMLPGCGTDNIYSNIAKMTITSLPVLTSSLAPSPATCSGVPVEYTPTSASSDAEFTWTRAAVVGITPATSSGSGAISETLTNSTVNPINVIYVYTTTDTVTSCSTAAENVVVTINPSPVLSSTTGTVAAMCSPAAFTYTPDSESIGATFAWSRATIAGITSSGAASGAADISQTLTNSTGAAINVTFSYTTTANSCSGPAQDVVVTVKPSPVLNSTGVATICSGSTYTYTASSATADAGFTWSRAAIGGITETANSGTGNISEVLTNTTNSPISVTYAYITTAASCSGSSENVYITVNPSPVLNPSATQSVCSGTTNTYTAASGTAGATFAWTRATVADITPVGTTGTGSAVETFTNTTNAPINVIYTYTTTANGCVGPAQNKTVTVSPIPSLSSDLTPDAVCSETAISYGYTATSAVAGATFAWTRAAIASINSNASGSGTGNVSEVLRNYSTAAVTVRYVYTATANGCAGAAQNVDVSIKPRPILSSSGTETVCSGTASTYTATSGTAGPTFSWSRAAVAGISEAAASGTANPIGETLTNTTSAPIDVAYMYTTTADGCASESPETVTITIIPSPIMLSSSTATICTGTSLATIPSLTFASDMTSTYAWTRANTAGIDPTPSVPNASNPIDEILTNTTAATVITTYVVTPTASPGGCPGTPQNVNVSVTPAPAQPNAINANPN